MKPTFSIVIPTRDRLDCLEIIIKSLLQQNFEDFEVIISDNGVADSAYDLVTGFKDERLKYYKPNISLGLCDNFEFASTHITGEWALFFGDKNILYSNALEKLYNALKGSGTDILNFAQDFMSPFDPDKSTIVGKLKRNNRTGKLWKVNKQKAIEKHLSCKYLMAGNRKEWYLGSIHSGGVYHESFISKIRNTHISGRLFDGMVPDRYGAAEALCLADRVFYLDDSLCVYNSCGKNTWRSHEKKGYDGVISFIKTSHLGYDISESLEIPGVIGSVSNIIATDYRDAVVSTVKKGVCKQDVQPNLGRGELAASAFLELNGAKNISEDEIVSELRLLENYVGRLSWDEKEIYRKRVKMRKKQNDHVCMKASVQSGLYSLSASDNYLIRKPAQKALTLLSRNSTIINSVGDFMLC